MRNKVMGLRLYRKAMNLIKPYHPEQYWQEKGKEYFKKFQYDQRFLDQEAAIISVLKELNFNHVLEFGCGFGRITKLITDNFKVKTYHAFDLSQDQIHNASMNCFGKNIIFSTSTIDDFKSSMKYDLVIGAEVLLHIPPIELQHSVKHLLDLSSKYFVTIDPYKRDSKIHGNHDFIHDYQSLFFNYCAKEYKIESAGQAIWVVQK